MITNIEGKVVFKNRQDSIPDFGSVVFQGDKLDVRRNATLTVTYYSGCRQDTIGKNSLIRIGLTKSIIERGNLIRSEIVKCEVPQVVLDSDTSHSKGGLILRNVKFLVKALGCTVSEKPLTSEERTKMALSEAKNAAIIKNNVYVNAGSEMNKYKVEDYVLRTISSAYLHKPKILLRYERGQETCAVIEAELDSEEIKEVIKWVIDSTKQTNKVRKAVLPRANDFKVKIWTHKGENGYFRNGEPPIIHIRSEKDAYLILDYYQADGSVVHLVPYYFQETINLKAKQTYTFGDQSSGFVLKASPPFGAEVVRVIVSIAPFDDVLNRKAATSPIDQYLKDLKVHFSGMSRKVKLAEASITIRTMP